ncbi:MAG: hypothetical protein OEY64_03120 [Nitrospinota bacterium]|nr:hypothetical protein [Nitrospinota bacterium]
MHSCPECGQACRCAGFKSDLGPEYDEECTHCLDSDDDGEMEG